MLFVFLALKSSVWLDIRYICGLFSGSIQKFDTILIVQAKQRDKTLSVDSVKSDQWSQVKDPGKPANTEFSMDSNLDKINKCLCRTLCSKLATKPPLLTFAFRHAYMSFCEPFLHSHAYTRYTNSSILTLYTINIIESIGK